MSTQSTPQNITDKVEEMAGQAQVTISLYFLSDPMLLRFGCKCYIRV